MPAPETRVVRIAGAEHRVRFEPYEGGLLAYLERRRAERHCRPLAARPAPLPRQRSTAAAAPSRIARRGRQWRLTARGASHLADVLPEHVAMLSRHMIEKVPPDLSRYLICPMPGLLTALHVGEGDQVEAGQPLAVVEAMKMENILRAEKAGTVKKANAKAGRQPRGRRGDPGVRMTAGAEAAAVRIAPYRDARFQRSRRALEGGLPGRSAAQPGRGGHPGEARRPARAAAGGARRRRRRRHGDGGL